jgi:hypothetical protein
MRCTALMLLAGVPLFAGQVPTTDEIVAQLMERDLAHRSSLGNCTWASRYVLDNKDRHAEMLVRWTHHTDGTKQYEVISEHGDDAVRDHVFHKLLESEVEASQLAFQERSRLNTANYSFLFAGEEGLNGRPAYVLEIQPKTDSKYLTKGRVWIDAADYAVVRVEGAPSKKPSFWTNTVTFVQTYEKAGAYWMAASNRSVTDAKLFGKADLSITYTGYEFSPTVLAAK